MNFQFTSNAEAIADRVKLPLTFDAEKMLQEIQNLNLPEFVYYDVLPLRAPAHVVDPSLPFPDHKGDFADGSWTEWSDADYLENMPYIASVVNSFREHTKVNLVRLLRLAPGATVKEHTDPTLGIEEKNSVIRLTVPILSNEDVVFYLNQEPVPMKPGECWYLRLTDPHSIINSGSSQRINMSIDMIPNDWVKNLIKTSQK